MENVNPALGLILFFVGLFFALVYIFLPFKLWQMSNSVNEIKKELKETNRQLKEFLNRLQ